MDIVKARPKRRIKGGENEFLPINRAEKAETTTPARRKRPNTACKHKEVIKAKKIKQK